MATNFPTSLDNFTNPSSGNTLDSPSHSLQHSDANDAIEAIEAKLGIGASPAGSATSGYVLTAGSGGTTTWQALPSTGGKVIQILNATYGTQTNSTSTTNITTGLSVSITPTSASNKVLIFVHQNGIRTTTNNNVGQFFLRRGSTDLVMFEVSAAETGTNITMEVAGAGATYLDSPATTSATTYSTVFNRRAGTGTLSCQYDGAVSSITVMEVTP